MWKVTANVLNKPTMGGPPAWRLGKGLTIPHYESQFVGAG